MPLPQSQDEFADLPDIVDFAAIPVPADVDIRQAQDTDEFAEYDIFNDLDSFTGINFDTIAELGPIPLGPAAADPAQSTQIALRTATSNHNLTDTSSQHYFDELDTAAWEEVDAIVRTAMGPGETSSTQSEGSALSSSTPPYPEEDLRRSTASAYNVYSSHSSVKR